MEEAEWSIFNVLCDQLCMNPREVCEVSHSDGGWVSWNKHITHQISIESKVRWKLDCFPELHPNL